MNATKIIACDPGVTGAFAFYDPALGRLDVIDMPTTTAMIAKRDRAVIDEEELAAILRTYSDLGYTTFFCEKVGGLPGQSAPNAFTFGYGVGLVMMAARLLDMRLERVRPQEWKAKLKVPADKKGARTRASELMPTHKHLWPLVKHDGRAEAAMLALYGEMATRVGR